MSDSIGESNLYVELQNRGLSVGLFTNEHYSYTIGKGELSAFVYEKDIKHTMPDYWWKFLNYMAYLDGIHVHKSSFRTMKDANIKHDLEELGFTVDRFRYDRPTVKAISEIADKIEKRLLELGYPKEYLKNRSKTLESF